MDAIATTQSPNRPVRPGSLPNEYVKLSQFQYVHIASPQAINSARATIFLLFDGLFWKARRKGKATMLNTKYKREVFDCVRTTKKKRRTIPTTMRTRRIPLI